MCFLYCACCAKSLSAEVCPYFSKSLTPTIDALPNDINTRNPCFIGNLILRFSINVKIYDRICALCSNDKAICPLCCLVLQRCQPLHHLSIPRLLLNDIHSSITDFVRFLTQ